MKIPTNIVKHPSASAMQTTHRRNMSETGLDANYLNLGYTHTLSVICGVARKVNKKEWVEK